MHQETGGSVKSPVEPMAQSPLVQIGAEKRCKPLSSSRTSSHCKASIEDHLDSWKAIATYLNRDIRTVQRWEKKEGLPVRRHPHLKASSVYGLKTEIDEWRRTRSLTARWARESASRAADTLRQLDRLTLNLTEEIIVAQKEPCSRQGELCSTLILYCFPSKFVFFVSFCRTPAYDGYENVPSAAASDKSHCYFAPGGKKCAI